MLLLRVQLITNQFDKSSEKENKIIFLHFSIESTRLSISPFSIHKICTESVKLTDFDGKSVNVEKGIEIILPIESLQRHPDFYKDPGKFTPERFLDSSVITRNLTNAGIYQPFGNGPRQVWPMLNGIQCFYILFSSFDKSRIYSFLIEFFVSICLYEQCPGKYLSIQRDLFCNFEFMKIKIAYIFQFFACLIGQRVGIALIKTVLYNLVGKYEFSLNSTKKMPVLPNGLFSFNQNYAELRMKRLT